MLSFANPDDRVEIAVEQERNFAGREGEDSDSFQPEAARPSASFRITRRIALKNMQDLVLSLDRRGKG